MGMPKKQTGIGITGIPDHSFFHLKSNKSMRYGISKSTAPTMPTLGKGTECIKLLLSQASKGMHEPLVPMFISRIWYTSAVQNFAHKTAV